MRRQIFFLVLTAVLAGCGETDYTRWVDPKIGSGGHGHVFVGASVPFGLVQVGPTSIPKTWDWCSGYHDSDSTVIGFSHTHLSGTGIGDLFDVTVMPVVGPVTYARGREDEPESGLWSYADRTAEQVEPGYYSVPLLRYGVRAEMTATERVGLHRYTFPASDEAALVLDLENGGCWDKVTDDGVEVLGDRTLRGWRHSSGWARDQEVYFYLECSKPFTADTLKHYTRLNFSTREGEQVLLKVSLSNKSMEGAQAAMQAELPGWNFDGVRREARSKWNAELSRVELETSDEEARTIFYTALYHSFIAPSLLSDVDEKEEYTTYSLWDTYRAAMPMLYFLQPERRAGMVNTMLDIFDRQGKLPVWHLWGNETDCMVGCPGVIATADAVVKGLPGVDAQRAYEACKASMMLDERGLDLRRKYGYIPFDLVRRESIASDMEYAIADAAVSHAAATLGKAEDADYFAQRSHSWRNYFDPSTGFVRGRDSKGGWRTPFDPFSSVHRADDYCEGNAWQYTWLVPQDLQGLQEAFGGREQMLAHLDSLFVAPSILGPFAPPDMSGMIGQYVHGNEHSSGAVQYRSRRAFGQRGCGTDERLVHPLVPGLLSGGTGQYPLLVRVPPVREGGNQGGRWQDLYGGGPRKRPGYALYPAGMAQRPALCEGLCRVCRYRGGRDAAL